MKTVNLTNGELVVFDSAENSVSFNAENFTLYTGLAFPKYKLISYQPDIDMHRVSMDGINRETMPIPNDEYEELIANVLSYREKQANVYFGKTDPEIADINAEKAKGTRLGATLSSIICLGVSWQVDDRGRASMETAIRVADWNNYPTEMTQEWTLTDNSKRATTAADLKTVLTAYALREADIWTAYNTWRAGDKLTPFSV